MARKLGMDPLPANLDINRCGHFLTTSLIKCASLTLDGSSSDFDPWKYPSNVKCITERFVHEMLNHAGIEHILVLGSKAQKALTEKVTIDRASVHDYLCRRGKTIYYLPHPSRQNAESVQLACLDAASFPTMEEHQEQMCAKYKYARIKGDKPIGDEASYKSTRAARWPSIAAIRRVFDA